MVSRPVWRMSATGVRMTTPLLAMAKIESSVSLTSAPTSEPRSCTSFIARTP